uniref:ABC transporter substrate-binding protein n=1 Tax=Paenibacillus gorillae TaxID=1243662 RepID=UPI0005A8E996
MNHSRKFHQTLVAVLLIAIVVMILSGCSSNGKSNKPDQDKPQEAKVTIPFWITPQDKGITAWFTKWTNEFNKSNPGIEVKLEFVPQDAWQQKLKAAQSNGSAPQISYSNYASIPMNMKQGMVAALDDYIEPKVFEDLYDNINELIMIGGKHYSFPVFVEPYELLFYRKDFFEEAGLDPNSPPKSWDELIEAGKVLSKPGRFGLSVPGSADIGWTHWSFQNMIGHFPISDDWSKATVNDDQYRQLFTFWKRLYDEKVVPKQALAPA